MISHQALAQKLDYVFANPALLQEALTHVSATPNRKSENYQRLEFLGDHILGAVLSDMLFVAFANADEGELSRRYTALARAETCTQVALEMGLGAHVKMSSKEPLSGARYDNMLADICEAVIAAIYLDGGYESVRKVVQRFWGERLLQKDGASRDAKSTLQEWAQGLDLPLPHYDIVDRSGPDHEPTFTIRVSIAGKGEAVGTGATKRIGEQNAAQAFLRSLGKDFKA